MLQANENWRQCNLLSRSTALVVILGLRARCRFKGLIEAFWQFWLSRVNITCLLPPAMTVPARDPGQAQRCPAFLLPMQQETPSRRGCAFPTPTTSSPQDSGSSKEPLVQEAPSPCPSKAGAGRWEPLTAGPGWGGRGQFGSRCRFLGGWGLKGSRDLGRRLQNFPNPPLFIYSWLLQEPDDLLTVPS